MDEKVKTELDKIVSVLANTGIVSKIILFGSYARGEETHNSDIDLCVLTPIEEDVNFEESITDNLREKLWDVQTMPMDLFTFNQNDFLAAAKRPTSFHHHIAETGKILYEQQ